VTLSAVLGTGFLLLETVVLLGVALRPARRPGRDDAGDGRAVVLLPRPRRVRPAHLAAFFVVGAALIVLLVGVRPGLGDLYDAAVAASAHLVGIGPTSARLEASRLDSDLPIVVAIALVSLGAVVPAPVGRRLSVAAEALLFLALAVVTNALLVAVAVAAALPATLLAVLVTLDDLAIVVLVVISLVAANYRLPRPTTIPVFRGPTPGDRFVFLGALATSAAVALLGVGLLAGRLAHSPAGTALLVFLGYPTLFDLFYLSLLVLGQKPRPQPADGLRDPTARHPLPPAGQAAPGGVLDLREDRPTLDLTDRLPARPDAAGPTQTLPPISVIIPAYNEEAGIAETLHSLDVAAARYGGPVTVIVADDGSTDRTAEVVQRAMDRFVAARGRLVQDGRQGKSGALNSALRRATSEIVIRVDADVLVDPDAFRPLPAWFADPTVGTVGALALPRLDQTSFFARGRLFECLLAFAFGRPALQRVDAIGCVPGTFTAFRRQPALFLGGYVEGMNGEDTDLTMQLGRLGYRAVADLRIRSYEDVPATLSGFLEQRTRWNRAGVQVGARHSPLTAGNGGPRTWFLYGRGAMMRAIALVRPLIYLYALALAIVAPSERRAILLVLVAWVFSALPTLAVLVWLTVRQGFARRLVWLPIWYPFVIVRRWAVIQALLSLPLSPAPAIAAVTSPAPASPAEPAVRAPA
jgi:cellulose synthase/poly-beta-1,6-N-acetylglucosamine synthase-like glycosyltransferase